MDRTERFYKIDQMLNERKLVPLNDFLEELGVSRATFKRDLEYLRDRLSAPIAWDRDAGGYRFVESNPLAPKYELPGLWFNSTEIHALLTMQHLLANIQPGLLEDHIQPLQARLNMLLESGEHTADEVQSRIKILHSAARQVQSDYFELISHALLIRKRLNIVHYSRSNNQETTREVSPQRLVYYRDNWYLDAWCHLRNGLRSFSIDTIRKAELLASAADKVDEKVLDDIVGAGYGIFSGKNTQTAVLRFTPERARWVAAESWHPEQKSLVNADGSFMLEIPYADDRELIMDILKYGPDVKVISPESLCGKVKNAHADALRQY